MRSWEVIFGNDSATGDRAVTGFDSFSPMQVIEESVGEVEGQNDDTDRSSIRSRKRNAEEGTTKIRHRRTQSINEYLTALLSIAESFKKIAHAIEMQATLDTINHINWQLILEKLQGMNLDKRDIMQLMKAFQSNEGLAKMFMNLTDRDFVHDLVFETLGRDPPPQATSSR